MAALFATVLIALMVVGFSYAYWNETLTIGGSVATGELNVAFSAVDCTDNDGSPDVGTCTVSTTEQTMTVTIGNAYPSYECIVTFTIDNTGTIPAKVESITPGGDTGKVSVTLDGIVDGEVIGVSKDCTLTLHVLDGADENGIYTVSMTIVFTQFNA